MRKKLFTLLLALVAIATTAQAQENMINGHEYVDLGLPSGTLWATCNVGANSPEEYGDYFAWGETEPKEDYSWNTYKWGKDFALTKYCNNSERGKDWFTDDKTVLDPEDDAATANWGEGWRMPTIAEIEELLDNTESEWVTQNGVSGRLFTATNGSGNSIFLPAWGSYECYWSSSLYVSNPAGACSLCFSSENVAWYGRSRFFEHSVRPVAVKNQAAAGLLLNAENFPDANFRAALAEILEISEGDEITAEKIAATTYIDVLRWGIEDSEKISDLTGIEYFTALKQLWCTNNQLTSLDVSKNTALRRLYCDFNQLTLLNVSKNIALIELSCYGNQLTSLDVSKNTELTKLSCGNNRLISLDVSQNTALTELICYLNQLTSLDVSKNTALTWLRCDYNQLASLDVSKNTALTLLYCYYNQLTSLDVSKNTALTTLSCSNNQLTSLDVSKNTALTELRCYSNQIKGKEMDALVASLPTVQSGKFYVIDTQDENEGNVCTKSQVAVAKGKGWTVYAWSDSWQEYEGSDPVEEDIDPVDENDNVDFGSDMDENSNLDGNVIGDIFYNISDGNGEYDPGEGCIVITKPTDDGTVNGLEGKDIFGEDVKNNFTGIIFKVPVGKGTIKVNAETTGNKLLKVKIGSNDPVEMELNGKLKVTFPYNVSEPTYVYIYAGAANEAKGFGKASATDAALKIYGIEFLRDDTPTDIDASPNDNGQMTNDGWYTIDGVKLNGEPTQKGIYVVKSKKVKR